jgi:hypothetical protein
MNSDLRLRKLIADVDGAARREIALAAREGRFDELLQLTPIAKEIAALAMRWPCDATPAQMALVQPEATTEPIASAVPLDNVTAKPSGKFKRSDYPKYLREKNDLVKLGWSPREKGPYEHRVPKTGVDAVASAVASRGKSGHRFTMEEILNALTSAKSGEQVLSYQTYAVVSWLKWAGMVLQHGRRGYTIVRPQTFATSTETAWQSLPQR